MVKTTKNMSKIYKKLNIIYKHTEQKIKKETESKQVTEKKIKKKIQKTSKLWSW